MPWFVVVLAGCAVVIGWRRFSRYAAERDWVYNKHNPRPTGLTSLGTLEEIYQPSIRHVVEEITSEMARGNQDETGDRPFPLG